MTTRERMGWAAGLLLLFVSCAIGAIAYVTGTASSLNNFVGVDGSGTFNVIVPSGCAAGQLALCLVYADSGTISGSGDWTQVTGSPWGDGALPRLASFYKILADSLDTCAITIAGSGSGAASTGAMAVYSGVDATTSIEVIGSGSIGTGTPMTATSINVVTAGSWVLGLAGRGDNEACESESIGGVVATERLEYGTVLGSDAMVNLYDLTMESSGASGAGTSATSTGDPWVSVLIALKPQGAAVNTKAFFHLFW